MDRLAGDAERITDLLPGPTLPAGGGDVVSLDPFRESVQSEGGAETQQGIA